MRSVFLKFLREYAPTMALGIILGATAIHMLTAPSTCRYEEVC